MQALALNKRARYDYQILETWQAGLVLKGFEVKAIKTGHISLQGAYVVIKDNEAFLINAHIPPYQPANTPDDYDSRRSRKLLLTKREIKSLIGKTKQKGLTLLPLRVYNKKGKVKIEIGLGKGKKKRDKRENIKKREAEREMQKMLKKSLSF